MKKSPSEAYILVCVTGGLYIFFWISHLVRIINTRENSSSIDLDRDKTVLIFSWLAFFFSVPLIILVSFISEILVWILVGILLITLIIYLGALIHVLYQIAKHIREIEITQSSTRLVNPWFSVILYFLWFLAVPYLQDHINKLETDSP